MKKSILTEWLLQVCKNSFLRFWFSMVVLLMMSVSVGWGQTNFSATYTFGSDGNVEQFTYNGELFDGISMGKFLKVEVTTSSSLGNFRATNWPLGATDGNNTFTGAVDLEKYFSVTIDAVSGYKFTVTSITFGVGRSATGTRQFLWRGSNDSYGSNLSIYSNLASGLTNNNGVITNPDTNSSWTGSILSLGSDYSNISTSASFRIYFFNSESTGGTAGLQGPITILGTYQSIVESPSLTTPSSSSINSTSATLGATITSNGGEALSARGTVYGTTPQPTGNALAEGGTAVEAFSHSRTGLTPNTLYYFRGYATNSAGTGYSPDGIFTTLHNAPTIGDGNDASASGFTANWTAPDGGGSATYTYEVQVDDNSDFSSVVFSQSNINSGQTSIAVTDLSPNTPYYYRVRANNAGGNSAWSATSAVISTLEATEPLLTLGTLEAFGGVCVNSTAGPNSFSIIGSALTSASVTVSSLSGYFFSTTSDGTYSNLLSIEQSGGSFSQTIYVKFTPTLVQLYNGDITIGGGGADSKTVAASGSGISTPPTVVAGSANNIIATSATVPGTITNIGCSSITAYGIEYSTTNNFSNGSGTQIAGANLSEGSFSVSLTGLTQSQVYYYKAYATNSGGTSYSSQGSFTTAVPTISVSMLTTFDNQTVNTTSAEKSYTVSGTNLVSDISIVPPTGFEVSTASGENFVATNPILLSPTNEVVNSTTIYVRFKPTEAISYSGNIQHTTTGATTQNVAVSGIGVAPAPPTAVSQSAVSKTGFTANWGAVVGAEAYRLDISTSTTFTSSVFKNIVSWDFPNDPDDAIADGGVDANIGKSISTIGGTSDVTFNINGATTKSANATGWESGNGTKYWLVDFNASGFYNLRVSSKQRASNTGPRDFKLQYKIGISGSWSDVDNGVITTAANFTSGVVSNLSLPSECNNQSQVFLRWIMTSNTGVNGSPIASTGTSQIDDILIEGNEPSFIDDFNNLSVSGTSQSVTGLTPNTTYYYRVRATASNSTSTSSNVITVTTTGTEATDQFRSAGSGNWGSNTTWQSKDSNVDWMLLQLLQLPQLHQ